MTKHFSSGYELKNHVQVTIILHQRRGKKREENTLLIGKKHLLLYTDQDLRPNQHPQNVCVPQREIDRE